MRSWHNVHKVCPCLYLGIYSFGGVNNTPLHTCGPHLLIHFQFGVYASVTSLVKFFPIEIVFLFSPLDRLLLAYRVQLTFFSVWVLLSCNITKFNHSKQLVVESLELSLHVTMSSENTKLNYVCQAWLCLPPFLACFPGWDLQCCLLGVTRPVILVLFLILSFEFFSTQYDVLTVGFSFYIEGL